MWVGAVGPNLEVLLGTADGATLVIGLGAGAGAFGEAIQ